MKQSIYEKFDKIIDSNSLFHSYLIEVGNYEEDFKMVLTFVKMIVSNKDSDYVLNNDCDVYNQIDSMNYVDLVVIEPDGNFIKKEQMLNLKKNFMNTSLLDNKRVYIVKECDRFNGHSANTMLKFLEEPSDNVIAILLTTNRYKVIDTILSRCQVLSIKNNDYGVEDSKLLEYIINPEKIILNYSDIMEEYFKDKGTALISLKNIKGLLLKKIEEDGKNIYSDMIIVIENNINKLQYNLNYKLWFDTLIAELLEVYYGYSSY